MSNTPPPASRYAVALLGALIRGGLRDVVVCPGARSQALALAAAAAEQADAIRLHVRVDERSAAFFALGIARETGMPTLIIVTSGTAVANLAPAAAEADEGRIPMIFATADRPAVMRGRRSNQTTRQAGSFGNAVRLALDIDVDHSLASDANSRNGRATAVPGQCEPQQLGTQQAPEQAAMLAITHALGRVGGAAPGPVQLNMQFREPLSGWPDGAISPETGPQAPKQFFAQLAQQTAEDTSASNVDTSDTTSSTLEQYQHQGAQPAVVIAGEGAGAEAERFAREAGLPLLAEVVSGSRYGRQAIAGYATLIDRPELGGRVNRAIVFGHPTLTRQVPALLSRSSVDVVVVDPHAGPGVAHYHPIAADGSAATSFSVVHRARIAEGYDRRSMHRWLGEWVVADRELRERRSTTHQPDLRAVRSAEHRALNAYARNELAAMREPVSRELLVENVWRASWPHDRLMLAASRLVRTLDSLAVPRKVEVRANRGLAGIDGTVATALGVAMASQLGGSKPQAGVTRVLIGDLALLHDANSLLLSAAETRPRVQLFVGIDGGGSIFDTLEVAQSAPAEAFNRVMYTPHQIDLAALAQAYGWEYQRAHTRGALARVLTAPVTAPQLVEVPLPR